MDSMVFQLLDLASNHCLLSDEVYGRKPGNCIHLGHQGGHLYFCYQHQRCVRKRGPFPRATDWFKATKYSVTTCRNLYTKQPHSVAVHYVRLALLTGCILFKRNAKPAMSKVSLYIMDVKKKRFLRMSFYYFCYYFSTWYP